MEEKKENLTPEEEVREEEIFLPEEEEDVPDERDFEIRRLILENEALKRKEAEKILEDDLMKVRKLDPHIKRIEDLGEIFIALRAGGVPCEDAYRAALSLGLKKDIPQMGDINAGDEEKEYFTPEEVKNMSQAEVKKHYEKIRKSMSKWKA